MLSSIFSITHFLATALIITCGAMTHWSLSHKWAMAVWMAGAVMAVIPFVRMVCAFLALLVFVPWHAAAGICAILAIVRKLARVFGNGFLVGRPYGNAARTPSATMRPEDRAEA